MPTMLRQGVGPAITQYPSFRPWTSFEFLSGSLNDTITLNRSSNGTYRDSSGVLQTAGNNVGRFDHDPSGNALGLLVEGQRTNLFIWSEQLDQAGTWINQNASITANDRSAPDNANTADKIVEDSTAAALHGTVQAIGKAASSLDYAFSMFWNRDERDDCEIWMTNGTVSAGAIAAANLLAGTIGNPVTFGVGFTGGSSRIEAWTSNWYRAEFSANTDTATSLFGFPLLSDGSSSTYNGDGTSGAHAWGAQVEQAPFGSSYVQTVGTSATRAADIVSTSFTAGAVGTQVIQARTAPGISGSQVCSQLDDGTEGNRVRVERNASREIRVIFTNASTEIANLDMGVVADSTTFLLALRWEANNFGASLNGGTVVTDTGGAVPTGMDTLRFGRDTAGEEWFGHLQRNTIYPTAVSDESLQTLSA